jgi:hypothetical protein
MTGEACDSGERYNCPRSTYIPRAVPTPGNTYNTFMHFKIILGPNNLILPATTTYVVDHMTLMMPIWPIMMMCVNGSWCADSNLPLLLGRVFTRSCICCASEQVRNLLWRCERLESCARNRQGRQNFALVHEKITDEFDFVPIPDRLFSSGFGVTLG